MPDQPSNTREQITTAIVALAVLALSLPDGGYSAGVYAGATVLVWWAVLLVAGFGFGPRGAVPTTAIVAGAALAGFALLTILSMAWSEDAGRAYEEAIRAAGYAGLFVLVVMVTRRGEAGAWLTGIAIGFAAVGALALLTRFLPSLPGGDADISESIPAAAGRLSYPIGYWNGLGAAMAIAIVLLTWLSAAARTRAARALAVGAMPACVLAIYLASSRGGAGAAAVGLLVLVGLGRERGRMLGSLAIGAGGGGILVLLASTMDELVNGVDGDTATSQGHELFAATVVVVAAAIAARWLLDEHLDGLITPPRIRRVALGLAAVAVFTGLVILNPPKRIDEFNDPPTDTPRSEDFVGAHSTSTSGEGRYQFWSAALDAFGDEPIAGIGAGGYEAYWNQNGDIARTTRNAHSLFFQTLGELGILGIALLLTFFAAAAVAAVAAFRGSSGDDPQMLAAAALAVVVAGVVSSAVDWTWEIPAVFAPVVIGVALLTGPALGEEAPGRVGSRRAWGIAAVAAGAAAICAAGLLMLSQAALDSSRDAVDDDDLPAALDDARDAAALQPWSATPRLQIALVDELEGDLPAARRRIDQAIDRAPQDWRLWLVKSRLETKSGEVADASESLDRAEALNPRSPVFQQLEAE